MRRLHQHTLLFITLGVLFCLSLFGISQAEVRYQLLSPIGEELPLTTINQKRESDSLVLYTPEYGASTRTNPYGVEVAAVPVPGSAGRYKVTQASSVFTCEAEHEYSKCGNMPIPPKGIVLSATGNKRDILLQAFKPATVFNLNTLLTYESRTTIDAVNPTLETNPKGSGFPGFRGGNQMIVYDFRYGKPTTETNEFGFEVTVRGNRVVVQEGANSIIPQEEGAFVLSGHGKSREWLLLNAPIGSRIDIQDSTLVSTVDKDTYLYQLEEMVNKIQELRHGLIPQDLRGRIDALRWQAIQLNDEEVAHQALSLRQELMPVLWSSYPTVSEETPRAIWHRPSEATLKEIRQSLDLLKQAGFNTIYLETYLHGSPIFPSSTFKAYNIPQKFPFTLKDSQDADLLQVWLNEAHRRGMKVHVWFQTFYAANVQYEKGLGGILSTYPQWANVQRSAVDKPQLPPSTLESGAYFLDPANQDAQLFLLTLIDEILTRYPIDGFQLDYIRYPSSFPAGRYSYVTTTWGYTPTARSIFKARTGVDPITLNPEEQPDLWAQWNEFKTRQVDRFVQKAHGLVKMKHPNLPLSVAVFPRPEESLERKHQNWVAWAQQGWVDFIAPMTLTSSLESIAVDTKAVKEKSSLPVITGVFGPFNGNSPSEIIEQVWAAISAGASGVALFDTAHLTQKMAEALRMGIFREGDP